MKNEKQMFDGILNTAIGGEPENIFTETDSEQGVLGGGILKNLGLSPEYSYTGTVFCIAAIFAALLIPFFKLNSSASSSRISYL